MTINILHLSDIHFNNKAGIGYEPITNSLIETVIDHLQKRNSNLDFIVITGDIAFKGSKEEYEMAKEFIENLINKTNMKPEHLFIVPGNHDVNRSAISKDSPLQKYQTHEEWSAFWENKQVRDIYLNQRFIVFYQFVKKITNGNIDYYEPGHFFSKRITLKDGKILGIIGLNSACASEGDSDNKKLFIPPPQIDRAIQSVTGSDFIITLMHHPIYWLHESDQKKIEPFLIKYSDIVLFSHQHRRDVILSPYEGRYCLFLSANATFQQRQNGKNGLQFIEVKGNLKEIEVWPYIWTEKGGGSFIPDLTRYEKRDTLSFRLNLYRQHYIPKEIKDKILTDSMHRCCLCPEHHEVLDIHHIVPISEKGPNTENNLMAICPTCHVKIHRIRKRYNVEQLRMYKERWVSLSWKRIPLREMIVQAPSITLEDEEKKMQIFISTPYPEASNFTGRAAEKNNLTKWLIQDKDHPLLSIIGFGGMGKSALTWRWLQEDIIEKEFELDGIIWWSFFDKTSEFSRFLDYYLHKVMEVDPSLKESKYDKMEEVYKHFQNHRYIIVLDSVERMLRAYASLSSPYQDDEVKEDDRKEFNRCIDPDFGTFLQWLESPTTNSKTLITTRIQPLELSDLSGVKIHNLEVMDIEDIKEFFTKMGITWTYSELEQAAEYYGNHALSIRLLAGLINNDKKHPGNMSQWIGKKTLPQLKGNKKKYNILKLTYDALSEKSCKLARQVSAFRSSIYYSTIKEVNPDIDEDTMDGILDELEAKNVLLKYGQDFEAEPSKDSEYKYNMHPLVRSYFYKQLKKRGEHIEVHERIRNYWKKVANADLPSVLSVLEPGELELIAQSRDILAKYLYPEKDAGYISLTWFLKSKNIIERVPLFDLIYNHIIKYEVSDPIARHKLLYQKSLGDNVPTITDVLDEKILNEIEERRDKLVEEVLDKEYAKKQRKAFLFPERTVGLKTLRGYLNRMKIIEDVPLVRSIMRTEDGKVVSPLVVLGFKHLKSLGDKCPTLDTIFDKEMLEDIENIRDALVKAVEEGKLIDIEEKDLYPEKKTGFKNFQNYLKKRKIIENIPLLQMYSPIKTKGQRVDIISNHIAMYFQKYRDKAPAYGEMLSKEEIKTIEETRNKMAKEINEKQFKKNYTEEQLYPERNTEYKNLVQLFKHSKISDRLPFLDIIFGEIRKQPVDSVSLLMDLHLKSLDQKDIPSIASVLSSNELKAIKDAQKKMVRILFPERERGYTTLHKFLGNIRIDERIELLDIIFKGDSRKNNMARGLPKPKSLDDLAAVIELYHHTVRAGRYDEAVNLLYERLEDTIYFQIGVYQKIIELYGALFHEGIYNLPKLTREDQIARTLNTLAYAYSLSGEPNRAVILFEQALKIAENMGEKNNVATTLGNLAVEQIAIGDLGSAESNLRRQNKVYIEMETKWDEPDSYLELGRIYAYCGNHDKSAEELGKALKLYVENENIQAHTIVWAYRSLRALLMDDPAEGHQCAEKALEFAKKWEKKAHQNARDFIRAHWLLGASYVAIGKPNDAEHHLNFAITECRKINVVDHKAAILLELAKLRHLQNRHEEALKLAQEALEIANHFGYILQQADIHLFFAEYFLDMNKKDEAIKESHLALERSTQMINVDTGEYVVKDNPKYYYVPGHKKARDFIDNIEQERNRLVINLERKGKRFYSTLHAPLSHIPPKSINFTSPLDQIELDAIQWYLEKYVKMDKKVIDKEKKKELGKAVNYIKNSLIKYGIKLFNAVIQGENRSIYDRCIDKYGNNIRIEIASRDPELMSIPWELMCDPRTETFLARRSNIPFSRYLPTIHKDVFKIIDSTLNILLIVSNPKNKNNSNLDKLKKSFINEIDKKGDGINNIYYEILENPCWEDIINKLTEKDFHIIEFDVRGEFDKQDDQGYLVLTDKNQRRVKLKANVLRDLAGFGIQLILLYSCRSTVTSKKSSFSSLATALVAGGVPAVISMQYKVLIKSISTFSKTFYHSIIQGNTIEKAVASARSSMAGRADHPIDDWFIPVLYMRGREGRLVSTDQIKTSEANKQAELGIQLLAKGRLDKAMSIFEKSLSIDPLNNKALEGLFTIACRSAEISPKRMNLLLSELIKNSPAWLARRLCVNLILLDVSIGRNLVIRLTMDMLPVIQIAANTDGFGWEVQLTLITADEKQKVHTLPIEVEKVNRKCVKIEADTANLSWGLYLITIRFLARNHEYWRADQSISFDEPKNPYIAGPPIRNGDLFFGRTAILEKVMDRLKNYSIILLGPRRSGKTSLLYQLKDLSHKHWTTVLIDLHTFAGLPSSKMRTSFRRAVYHGCLPSLTKYAPSDLQRLQKSFERNSIKRLLILIDEIAVLSKYPQVAHQLRAMSKWQKPETRVVVAGTASDLERVTIATLDIGSPPFNEFTIIELEEISRQDSRKLVEKPVLGYYQYKNAAIEKLLTLGHGRPFFLNILANLVFKFVQTERGRSINLSHVEAAQKEAPYELGRWFREFIRELDKQTFCALPNLIKEHPKILPNKYSESLRNAGLTVGPRSKLQLCSLFVDWWNLQTEKEENK